MRFGKNFFFMLGLCLTLEAHEGSRKNQKPTQAKETLKQARTALDAAKKKLAAAGRYSCCVKPSCDLCAATTGSCQCAANVAAGKGSCGECLAGRKAGRGNVKGELLLLPSERQASAQPGELPIELQQFREKILNAKRTLVKEKRFLCCVGGGCTQCAFEAECPCGTDLATSKSTKSSKGVCGDCYDGWHSGRASFDGIPLADIKLAEMQTMEGMGPGSWPASGLYASGTAQQPGVTPNAMLTRRLRGWNLMLHGRLFGVYTNQTGPRGRDKMFGAGYIMPMASRRWGPGTLTVRAMFSPEPLTVTNGRYPLLFQEGETWKNVPILNGQHPHDFFMELAANYQIRLGERTSVNIYGGLRGDPPIGPVAYIHRVSQSENPIAVEGHHFQDSTHIANNVVTLGMTHGPLTLEASGFHGREPDERRWNLEKGAIDSFATRLTLTPTSRWQGQISVARINQREYTHPRRGTFRQTASITYVRPLSNGHWATTALWGRNHDLEYTEPPTSLELLASLLAVSRPLSTQVLRPKHIVLVPTREPKQLYNSYLAESTLFFRNKHWIWGRAELADKDSLLLYEEAKFVRLVPETRFTRIRAYTMGYSRELKPVGSFLQPSLGGQLMIFDTPPNLAEIYGSKPVGAQIILRMRIAPVRR